MNETRDNWIHRSTGMKCGSCMWFAVKKTADPGQVISEKGDIGRCRRHAPTMAGFPVVFTTDWCGDHKIDENR